MPHVLAQDLRDAVLQAAVSGGLTEKEAGDTNITEYYKSLIDNKASNVASKKWKKEFPVERIDNSEFEYDLGENWIWCYLGDICAIRGGKRVPVGRKLSDKATSQKYIRVADMKDHSVLLDGIKYLPDDLVDRLSLYTISKDDLYITVAGTIGDVGIIPDELDGANLTENADKIVFEKINKRWLLICLLSNGVQKQIKAATTQVGQPKLAIKRIQSLYIPLCPIEEQARIVAKVDELMAKIDEYEKIEKELTELQKAFPGNMKDAILQAAMQGKLTEQLESDEPICAYYDRMMAEKKVISKKEKAVDITNEEPFDIPDNWMWVTLNDLAGKEIRRGKSPVYAKTGKAMAFAQKCNSKYTGIRLDLALCLDDSSLSRYTEYDQLKDMDIVINSTGHGTLGRIGLYTEADNPDGKDYYPDSHVTVIRAKQSVNPMYLYRCLQYYSPYLETLGEGSTNQTELKPDKLKGLSIPLPPFEEQKRIVEKLDQLLPLCDQLEQMAA